jgi:hypothetical protein
MTGSAKSISISKLQTAVKAALAATQKAHPEARFEPADPTDSSPISYVPWHICGYPTVTLGPGQDFNKKVEIAKTFTGILASNPAVAALGIDGKFEPAVYVAGDQTTIGFVPSEVSLTS